MRRAVLLGLVLLLVAAAALSARPAERGFAQSTQPQPNADGSYTVPRDWPLLPADIRAGHSFRLLFITSQTHEPASTDIATYNGAVQDAAANGHSAIAPYAHTFRVVGSTATVDARDNTATTGSGLRIYWLDGNKLADDYADFYDGSWDSYANTTEQGGSGREGLTVAWTGSNQDGTAYPGQELGGSDKVRTGFLESGRDPLSQSGFVPDRPPLDTVRFPYLALSPVFTVGRHSTPNLDTTSDVPHDWVLIPRGLGPGDTFRLLFQTSTRRDATERNIFVYDKYVQDRAAAGHAAIQPYARLFRVVGSTVTVDARDHTNTNPNADGPGAPVYWLNGNRVAADNSVFWSKNWEHWAEADRRFESGNVGDDDGTWTGTKRNGTKDDDPLGDGSRVTTGSAFVSGHNDPIEHYRDIPTASHSFYALSVIFRVSEPPPRLVFSTTHMIVDEPPGCADAGNDVATFGPVLDRGLATYTVRLRSDPGGDATVAVYDPSDSRSNFYQYLAGNWGRVTNQPPGDASPVTDRWNGWTTLRFNSSNWNVPQTVTLNVHCASHDSRAWSTIWHQVTYPGDSATVIEGTRSRTVDNSRWQPARVKVIDTAAPRQPDDLSVDSAFAGTLQLSLSGSAYTVCEGSGTGTPGTRLRAGDPCEWGFGIRWNWVTGERSNDRFDAHEHFSSFRVKVESGAGDVAWGYSYVPEPTYTRSVKSGSRPYSTEPYGRLIERTGLFSPVGSAVNPGDPVYRITVTPVTIRGREVPGEAQTLCVQLKSAPALPMNKYPATADCATFDPAVIFGVVSQDSPYRPMMFTLPSLTITSDAASVTEGDAITYTISASPAPPVDTAVQLSVTEEMGDGGNRIGRQQLVTLTIPAGQPSATWTVTTLSDRTERADGAAVGEIMHGDGYMVGDPSSVSVALLDDDAPPGYTVDPDVIAKVRELASQSQHGQAHVNRWRRVLVAFGEHDGTGVNGGAMTAAEGQEMADEHSSPVWDDVVTELAKLEAAQQTPEVSITAGSGITEGGSASFTLTATPPPAADLVVGVTVGGSGDYGVTAGAQTVTISASGSATLTLPTTDDETDEADGSVTVTLDAPAADAGYTVSGAAGSASVSVADDDDAPSGYTVNPQVIAAVRELASQTHHGPDHVNRWNRVLVAFGEHDGTGVSGGPMTAAGAQHMDDTQGSPVWTAVVVELKALEASRTTPELSITAGSGISEGGTASFTITASPAPAAPLTVTVGVSESGSFGASGAATVTVSGTTTTYTVSTTDDNVDEADGSVTVTLQDGSGYTVSAPRGAATVGVSDDDDVPGPDAESGVSVEDASATEGSYLTFTVRLAQASTEETLVKWETAPAHGVPDNRAQMLDYTSDLGALEFAPGVTELTGQVWIELDSEVENDEYFAIHLFLGEEWKLKPDATGIMTIIDGD